MRKRLITLVPVLLVVVLAVVVMAAPKSVEERRKLATKEYNNGNYRDAFVLYEELLLKEKGVPESLVPQDYNMALNCLRSLGEHKSVDDFRDRVVKRHGDNWGLLWQAARSFFHGHHYGTIVAGEFERGYQRGGGRYVNTVERDRVAALALMDRTRAIIEGDAPRVPLKTASAATAEFYREFANMLVGYRGYQGAWRLLYLTDLNDLPDYVDGYYYDNYNVAGASVDEQGNPIFHKVPESYAAAKTDGERWRHFMKRAIAADASVRAAVLYDYAAFLYNQFGVHTMAYYGRAYGQSGATGEDGTQEGPFTLHTLENDESMARLATGVKRFKMPDDANYIQLYKELKAWTNLAQIFENRRQYPEAARYWKMAGYNDNVDQILGNWGQFHQTGTHPSGSEPEIEYRFRNGDEVSFEAHAIDVRRLLRDVRKYLESSPRDLDWNRMNIANIGYRLVHENQGQYLLDRVAKWKLALKPQDNHFDSVVSVKTPLVKAGAYLLTAKLKNGNVSKIVVWVDNTVIVRKQLNGASYFFVGDSVTGKVLPETKVEFFGYRQKYISAKWPNRDYYKVYTKKFARTSDKNGQVIVKPGEYSTDYNWLISVDTKERLAYLGFTGIWYGNYYDYEYNQTKVFTITDRPVYRPNQAVKYKFWLRHAKYDQDDTSSFANQSFTVRIHNPKGEKVLEETKKTDEWGGLDGEYLLPDDATLGVYSVQIVNYGGSSFRVEEYKKPEFEVTVEAPDKPVMLGEKIVAKIKAKYYFGSPVAKGKVKYKVLRYTHNASWYPSSYWDWFYGAGYWWFGYDYGWWPGCLTGVSPGRSGGGGAAARRRRKWWPKPRCRLALAVRWRYPSIPPWQWLFIQIRTTATRSPRR